MIFALLLGCATEPPPAPARDIRAEVITKLGVAGVKAVADAADPLAIKYEANPGLEPGTIYLDNTQARCLADPPNCDGYIDLLVNSTVQSLSAADEAPTAEQLRISIRPASTFEGMGDVEFVLRPFHGELVQALVFDSPASMSYVQADSLKDLGLDEDAAFAKARENLQAKGCKLEAHGDVVVATTDEGYGPSCALVTPEVWSEMDGRDPAPLHAIAVSRTEFALQQAEPPTALIELQKGVKLDPLPSILLTWDGTQFVDSK